MNKMLENHLVLPVADDMRDGDYECCECRDCGAHFYRDERVYRLTSQYDGEFSCPVCGSTELDEYTSARELDIALADITRSQSLKSLWDNEK